ncbi:MAG: HAMP domain-containing protein, partial [Candidatus Thermoplasmatota archaeon]|nr:HAMP domain-containing protein [Candidatus Thermoplasmatota archaeon]
QEKVRNVKAEVDDIRAEQDDMVEFESSIYNEHAVALRCFTTFRPVIVDAYIENKTDMNAANSITATALLAGFQEKSTTSPLHVEIVSDFTKVRDILGQAHKCFVENSTLYADYQLSQDDVDDILTALGAMLDDAMDDPEHGIKSIVELMDSRTLALEEDEAAALAVLNSSILLGIFIAISLAIGIGLILSNTMTSRLSDMIAAARSIKMGNLDVSVNEAGSDEITELGKAFNQMIMSVRLVAGDMGMTDNEDAHNDEISDTSVGEHGN